MRPPAFQRRVDDWIGRGLVTVWAHGFGAADTHPRLVAPAGSRWQVVDDSSVGLADRVVVTTPLPQASAMLLEAAIALDEQLMRTEYDRRIAQLVTLDRSPRIDAPGRVQRPNVDVGFVAGNAAKGVSATPAINAAGVGGVEPGALGVRKRSGVGGTGRSRTSVGR